MVAGVRQDSGSSIELDTHVAQLLIGQNQAEEYVEPAPKKAVKKPVTAKPKETPAPKADTPPPPASAAK